MAGVEGAEKVGDLFASAFPQNDPVRPHTDRGFDQILQTNASGTFYVRFANHQGLAMLLRWNGKLPDFLHSDYALVRIAFAQKGT